MITFLPFDILRQFQHICSRRCCFRYARPGWCAHLSMNLNLTTAIASKNCMQLIYKTLLYIHLSVYVCSFSNKDKSPSILSLVNSTSFFHALQLLSSQALLCPKKQPNTHCKLQTGTKTEESLDHTFFNGNQYLWFP